MILTKWNCSLKNATRSFKEVECMSARFKASFTIFKRYDCTEDKMDFNSLRLFI